MSAQKTLFNRLALIGVGLIGSSIARGEAPAYGNEFVNEFPGCSPRDRTIRERWGLFMSGKLLIGHFRELGTEDYLTAT